MRLFACLLFLFFIAPAQSQQKMSKEEFSEQLKFKCRLRFDEEIVERMENARIAELKIGVRDYISAEFSFKIPEVKKEILARVNVRCSAQGNFPEIKKSLATPREQIEQEDSGGRYYRHVAWQKNISGINWSGQVAHVDALHGDGELLPMNFYLSCLKFEENLCFQIDVQPPRAATRKVHSTIMKMISRIEHFE